MNNEQHQLFFKNLSPAQDSVFFTNGMFASYRENHFWAYRRPDDNVFITASILFMLDSLNQNNEEYQNLRTQFLASIHHFQQKDGLKTYNFYQTKTGKHFPNGRILHRFTKFKLPEDIDDTALVYLVQKPDLEQLIELKQKLSQHANGTKIWIKNTPRHYRKLRAYSTWFGLQMPIEFDVCALCNLTLLFERYGLPHNEFDEASIDFIEQTMARGEFLTSPLRIAQNYPRTALILYHYARLMHATNLPKLEQHRQSLIQTIEELLAKENNVYDRQYLEIAYMKLAHQRPVARFFKPNTQYKPFFIAGFLSGFANPIIKWLAQWPIFQINWRSEALDLALAHERAVLWERLGV